MTVDQPSDGDLIRRLSTEMDVATSRLTAPGDGRAIVRGKVRRNRRNRRSLTALAAVVAAVLLVGGIAAVRGTGDEDSVPVIAGPDEGAKPAWKDMPLLAPTGTAWAVNFWDPANDYGPSYHVVFESGGFGWSLMVRMPTPDTAAPDTTGTTIETSVVVGDRNVTVTEVQPPENPSEIDLGDNVWGRWNEGGFEVSLQSGAFGKMSWGEDVPSPSTDDLVAVVSSIEEVPIETWSDALQPPDGVPYLMDGGTHRPINLGLPSSEGSTRLMTQPWMNHQSTITPTGTSAAYQLAVGADEDMLIDGGQFGLEVPGGPRTVHGQEAHLYERPPEMVERVRTEDLVDEDKGLKLDWVEGTSHVTLLVPNGIDADAAVAFANSLVILNEAEWEALLFPDDVPAPLPAPASTTASSTSESALPAGVPRCLGLTTDAVSAAIDAPVEEVEWPAPSVGSFFLLPLSDGSASACRFEGERWSVEVLATARTPEGDTERERQSREFRSQVGEDFFQSLDTIGRENAYAITGERGGLYSGGVTVILDQTFATIVITDGHEGSDTYPGNPGDPARKPIIEAALSTLANALQG